MPTSGIMLSRDRAIAARASSITILESSEEFKILDSLVYYSEARVEGSVNRIIEQYHVAMIIVDQKPEGCVTRVDTNLCWALLKLAQRLPPSKHA